MIRKEQSLTPLLPVSANGSCFVPQPPTITNTKNKVPTLKVFDNE